MKQIITRIEEDLAEALKQRAAEAGESVNSYVTRLLEAPLGTLDALQLASADVLSTSRNEHVALLTRDVGQARAAEALGFTLYRPGEESRATEA